MPTEPHIYAYPRGDGPAVMAFASRRALNVMVRFWWRGVRTAVGVQIGLPLEWPNCQHDTTPPEDLRIAAGPVAFFLMRGGA